MSGGEEDAVCLRSLKNLEPPQSFLIEDELL